MRSYGIKMPSLQRYGGWNGVHPNSIHLEEYINIVEIQNLFSFWHQIFGVNENLPDTKINYYKNPPVRSSVGGKEVACALVIGFQLLVIAFSLSVVQNFDIFGYKHISNFRSFLADRTILACEKVFSFNQQLGDEVTTKLRRICTCEQADRNANIEGFR